MYLIVNAVTPVFIPITNLALSSVSANTIAITFNASSSGTQTWQYRATGASVWLSAPNGSSFGLTSGTFVGLSSSTSYDIQGTATNNGSSGSVTLTNIQTLAAYVAPTPTAAASRYDLVTDQSRVVPGAAITGSLNPTSGIWSGTNKTATITAGNGSTTVSLPSSGNAAVTFSVNAPNTEGGIYVTSTNTANLRTGAPVPVSVFTTKTGTAGTIATGTLDYIYLPQFGVQRCAWFGAPAGWSGTNGITLNKGWGRLKLPINGSATALFGRLTDADSTNATATVNSGTTITNIAQIYGTISGSQTISVILPASDKCVYLDYATDSAFTNPVRYPLKFFVRDKILIVTRSQMNMLLGSYANGIPGNQNWSNYIMGSGIGGQNPSGGGADTNGAYVRIDGVQSYGNYGAVFGGVGAQEIGRLHNIKNGVGYTIGGEVPAGGDIDTFWNQDGSPKSGVSSIISYLDNEFRSCIIENTGWSGVYTAESPTAYQNLFKNLTKWLLDNCPLLSTIAIISAGGMFGSDGSRATGYTRQNQWIEDLIEAVDPCVVSLNNGNDWNSYYTNSGHADWASAIRYARFSERALILASPTISGGLGLGHNDRFVNVSTTGTMVAGSGQIKIPINFVAGATAIVPKKWTNGVSSAAGWVYTTPTNTELACLWSAYQGVGGCSDSGAAQIAISSVTIDGNGNFVLTVPTGTTGPINVHFNADFNLNSPNNGSTWMSYYDNRDPGDGCGYGYGLRARVDIAITTV